MFKTIKATILQLILCTTVSAATFYVSPTGNNSNKGTSENMPFQVVQFAIDQMKAGDTLVVLDGFYTGTLHIKSGITIQAKNPRKVILSGAVPLTARFERHTDKIYKTRVDKPIKQLFFDDKPMIWAQWPDMQWSENWDESKKWALATKGTGPGVLTSNDFGEIADLELVGGYCFLRYGKGNSCYSRRIEAFDGNILHWNDDDFYSNRYTGEDGWRGTARALLTLEETHVYHPIHSKFFLAGDIDLLDAPGEWFVEDSILYFYPPEGMNPNEAVVLTKTIDYCIDQESAVSDVTIDGIDFFAGSVKFEAQGNTYIKFHNTYFTYPGGELLYIDKVKSRGNDKPNEVAGSNITFDKCLFAGAQFTAMRLRGSELVVQNCVFMENNRNATFGGIALGVNATGTYKITRNTFVNNCSDAIRISIAQDNYKGSVKPDVSYNNIFNAGKYNSDVSGIYMPVRSQKYTEIHHNWMHNVKGNACRLDVAGKELNVHHNVFWASKRGMSIEGYGQFNIYNNTDVLNHVASDLIKNVLNHTGATEAGFDSTFPPIDDWNVLNNIVEAFNDGVGPREKALYASQKEKGLIHSERAKSDELFGHNTRPLEGNIPVLNRGSIRGNLIGKNPELFTNGNLAGLNLIPTDIAVKNGMKPNKEMIEQGVTSLDSFCGAYDVGGDYWVPGSDWMPYGLEVLKTMAASERFAKEYYSMSIILEINVAGLPSGNVSRRHSNDQRLLLPTNVPIRIYHVSMGGKDSNPGTQSSPFRTLKKASEVLHPGDICIVHEGTYRECFKPVNSGTAEKPIVLKAADGEKVILSGMEALSDWQQSGDGIYKAKASWDLGESNFVLIDGKMGFEARFPNKTNDDPLDIEGATIIEESVSARGAGETLSSPVRFISEISLPTQWTTQDLANAKVWVLAHRKWSAWIAPVTGYNAKEQLIWFKEFEGSQISNNANPNWLQSAYESKKQMIAEVGAWQQERNDSEATVDWQFTTADARVKLKKLHPVI